MTTFIIIADSGYAATVTSGENTLKSLQTLVDGYIECVQVRNSDFGFTFDLWVNEEGLFREDFMVNLPASYLTGRTIKGPAVITVSTLEGRTVGLSEAQIKRASKVMSIDDENYSMEDAQTFFVSQVANS